MAEIVKGASAVEDRFIAWWTPMVARSLLNHGAESADFCALIASIGESAQEVFGIDADKAGTLATSIAIVAAARIDAAGSAALLEFPGSAHFYAERIAQANAEQDLDKRAALRADLYERLEAVFKKREGLTGSAAQAAAARAVYPSV